jgi:hypothetical protein
VSRRRRRPSEVEFDLEAVRDVMRLARRVVKRLAMIEHWLNKQRKTADKPTKDGVAAAFEFYGMDKPPGRARGVQ